MNFPAPRGRPNSAPTILRGVAAAILVSGWLGAAFILIQAANPRDADATSYEVVGNQVYPLTIAESKHDRQFVQRVNGNMGVWIVEFDAGLRSLFRPPGLGWTLLVAATAIGVGCLGLAKLSGEIVDEGE